jgi:hypothetical protein
MKYKAIKKFYDPIGQKRVAAGEIVEIPEKYLEAYAPYIQDIEKPMPEPVEIKAPTIEEAKAAPPMQIIEKKKPGQKKVK